MILPNWYEEYRFFINDCIDSYLNLYFKNSINEGLSEIKEAVLYSTKGGKKIRSILALEFYLIHSSEKFENLDKNSDIIRLCISIELLHAYSLIHDDLPAIDNDDYRRGDFTCWKKFSESDAILAGDLLNSLSFEILSEIGNISLLKYFGNAVGINGMLGGEVLDIFYENNPNKLNLDNLLEIHNKKTGKLIEFSVLSGLILANKTRDKNNKLSKNYIQNLIIFGEKLGLAFQVKDDLLDIEGTFEETGKSVSKDGETESKGFVYFMGISDTKEYLKNLIVDCKNLTKDLNSYKLDFIINYIETRKK